MKKIVYFTLVSLFMVFTSNAQKDIFVAPLGNDQSNGTQSAPIRTLGAALGIAEKTDDPQIRIFFRGGTYHLTAPEIITSDRMQGKQLLITAWQNEQVVISGTKKLSLTWKKGKGGLWKAAVTDDFDQVWINGEKKVLARYPNEQEGVLFNGTSEDALSAARIKKWKDPTGGFIHSMHAGLWGSQHYLITGKIKDSLIYEGGYQVTRPSRLHPKFRYVENIKEELDIPGEWFLDKKEQHLYYYPGADELLENAEVEVAVTPQLLVLRGSVENPLSGVTIEGLCFTRTYRSFMLPYETLMRSDWGIYRGGAVLLENTKDCRVEGCEFKELGGNALFLSRYALNDTVRGNHIHHTGGSAICLVGDTSAVRSPAFGYSDYVPYEQMDLTPGPRSSLYPRQCLVENNLIHDLGLVEKQVAGVEIQTAALIDVRHNTIYDIPRAGINVGDGAFGGHLIEYNDVFNTVLESSDHGAFNSWGRDRFWHPDFKTMDRLTQEHPELILLDALYTTIIRNNRFRCDHGWDIDLDDGSSNYHIYNNLCLRGGIKLREGFYRRVENNVVVNNSLHPHLWFEQCKDVVRRNLFMQPYYPISLFSWGEEVDYNFFATTMALDKVRKEKTDGHSIAGALIFKDAQHGDYTLPAGSDAFRIDFENIPMDRFGVYSSAFKATAKKPEFQILQQIDLTDESKVYDWMGAKIRAIKGLGDRSAYGLPDERGIIIVSVEAGSPVDKAGLQSNDVIRSIEATDISSVEEVFALTEGNRWKGSLPIKFFRNQQEIEARLSLKE